MYAHVCFMYLRQFYIENTEGRHLLDSGWKFYRGEANAEQPGLTTVPGVPSTCRTILV